MEQLESQLGAVDITVPPDVLDRIDEIVPPGVTPTPFSEGNGPPSVADPSLRRGRTA